MKIKDFDRAKEILKEIERCEERLSNLALPNASVVKIKDSDGYSVIITGILPGNEHEDHQEAVEFVQKLQNKYREKIKKLIEEFEAL